MISNEGVPRTLEIIAEKGADGFYKGEIGKIERWTFQEIF